MSSLLASLSQAGSALNVLQKALDVVQNNVDNANTTGYAKQKLNLVADPLDLTGGLLGGVSTNGLTDSRNEYAEEQVQRQSTLLGQYTAQAQTTSGVQALFDVSGTGGVSAALSSLFASFSSWSATPNDSTVRQNVLTSANTVANAINTLGNSLKQTASTMGTQISSTVDQINSLTAKIQAYNSVRVNQEADPGSEAQLYSSLQALSSLTNFTSVRATDGTVTVMMANGSPLVEGTKQYDLQASRTADGYSILDSQGNDVTSQFTSGQLGGLLDSRNRVMGSILGNSQQEGTLNTFAQTLADTVNGILESGTTSTDASATTGTALFTYDGADPTGIATTISLNSAITVSGLAPVDSSGKSNGNANQLAALGNATATQSTLGGMTLTGYFAQIAANAGAENSTATANESTQTQVVAQAKSLRDGISGVSLDEEAVSVLQYQKAYQAVSQVLSAISTLSDTLINIMNNA